MHDAQCDHRASRLRDKRSLVLGPLLGAAWGLSGIFYVTAVMALLALVVVARVVPTPHTHKVSADTHPAREMVGRVLADGRLLRLDFGIFVLHLVLTALFIKLLHIKSDSFLTTLYSYEGIHSN